MSLQGVRYQYKEQENEDNELNSENNKDFRLGFIAQAVEKVCPEAVKNMPDGTKAMSYTDLIPVLVEAIKEQQVQIDFLQEKIKACYQKNPQYFPQQSPAIDENNDQEDNPLKNTSINENSSLDIATAKLFQNTPNPFSMNTEIRFEIPKNSSSAKLLIHDMQGGEIKSYILTARGVGNIMIQGHELPAGMYMYTLLVNNTIVDTKKMILTK